MLCAIGSNLFWYGEFFFKLKYLNISFRYQKNYEPKIRNFAIYKKRKGMNLKPQKCYYLQVVIIDVINCNL